VLKKVQKLTKLGYIVKDISLCTNLGDLIIKRYTPGKPIKTLKLPHSPSNVDIRAAEFIIQELYITVVPDEDKIDSVINEKRYKHKNKNDLFIKLFIKDVENTFGKRFRKVTGKYLIQYECKEHSKLSISLKDRRTFKKGMHVTYTYTKPIIRFF
jgi:hypothetical protein